MASRCPQGARECFSGDALRSRPRERGIGPPQGGAGSGSADRGRRPPDSRGKHLGPWPDRRSRRQADPERGLYGRRRRDDRCPRRSNSRNRSSGRQSRPDALRTGQIGGPDAKRILSEAYTDADEETIDALDEAIAEIGLQEGSLDRTLYELD